MPQVMEEASGDGEVDAGLRSKRRLRSRIAPGSLPSATFRARPPVKVAASDLAGGKEGGQLEFSSAFKGSSFHF